MSRIVSNISRPLAVGAVAGVAAMLVMEGGYVLGVHSSLTYAAVGAAASGIQEVSRDYVMRMVTTDPFSSSVAQLVSPSITGLATVGLIAAIDLSMRSTSSKGVLIRGFLIGAAAEVAGGYIQKAVIEPAMVQYGGANISSF